MNNYKEEEDEKYVDEANNFQSALRSMKTTHKTLIVLRCKLIMIGNAYVGKTALKTMFTSNGASFPKNYIMTPGVDFTVKEIPIPDTEYIVELYIFDCSGQSVFNQRELNAEFWDGASYAMLVFDIGDRESFKSGSKWLQSIYNSRPTSSPPLSTILIGNKVDLREEGRGEVSTDEGIEFMRENQLDEYFETSAARSRGVEQPFQFIAAQFHQRYLQSINDARDIAERGLA